MESEHLEEPFLLFVYGTLKCGYGNHDRFCKGVLQIEEAAVFGGLYDLPFGFPALVVPDETIRATGTTNPAQDITTQHRLNEAFAASPQDSGSQAFGELLSFDDPEKWLPKLDHLEGFVPGEHSLYRRVLIPVETATRTVLAWAYAIEKPTGTHLPGGSWPARSDHFGR
jgi:gamma-glutamylcyclotransferase (GGCT)/AIG2-like uncharacterized protein YtfP